MAAAFFIYKHVPLPEIFCIFMHSNQALDHIRCRESSKDFSKIIQKMGTNLENLQVEAKPCIK